MAKLYFKYGSMGSSKTAQALIAKFNYEERGMNVWLIKPQLDTRDGAKYLRSRIGLQAEAYIVTPQEDLWETFSRMQDSPIHVIIADEAQFFTEKQIEQLREIVSFKNTPVMCFGLRTDFQTKTFPGSKRLLELADSITEIKTICACGSKAIVNARFDAEGKIITEGDQIMLGGNDRYLAMCYTCWRKKIVEQNQNAKKSEGEQG